MVRLLPGLALASLLAAPAFGADFGGYDQDFRPAYPDDWQNPEPLGFELGLRYWYSKGEDGGTIGGYDFNSYDTTQTVEAHLRIDDYSTSSYVKGLAGYSMAINGNYDTSFGAAGDIVDGRVGYAGADFGMNPFGASGTGSGIYGLIGYLYWNESPNMGRADFYPVTSSDDVNWPLGASRPTLPGDSELDNIDIHALRLGVSGKVEFNDYVDLSAELAAVPYAWVNGTLGSFSSGITPTADGIMAQSSATTVDGFAYGAMGEAMLGFHPTENVTLRLGGRAWYLQGQAQTRFSLADISAPVDTDGDGEIDVPVNVGLQDYVIDSNPFSLLRYGALVELTYKF